VQLAVSELPTLCRILVNIPTPGIPFHVSGVPSDVRTVHAVVMTLMGEGTAASHWLVRTADGALWVLTRRQALTGAAFEGRQLPRSGAREWMP
jgi:hypothetical protein